MRFKAISSFLLPFLGHLSDMVNSRSHMKAFEVLITFFKKKRLLQFTLVGGVQVTHGKTRQISRTSSRARLCPCVFLNPADPGFPELDSLCLPLPHGCGGFWALASYVLLRGLGAWTIRLFVVLRLYFFGFFSRQIYLVGFVYSSCYQ